LDSAITVHPSFDIDDEDENNDGIVEKNYNSHNSAKVFFGLTLQGKTIEKKKWFKVRVGERLGRIIGVSNSGDDTRIRVRLNYGKMPAGQYNVKLTYKDRLKKKLSKNGKPKYRKYWEKETITNDNSFVVPSN